MDGNPQGDFQTQTDDNGSFTVNGNFTSPITIEILSLDNDIQQSIKCGGISLPGTTQIKVSCSEIQW